MGEIQTRAPTPDPASHEPPSSARLGAYLRRLREGYGYTLRKVEERASVLGEPIDNSQLSRFEKGKAVPSFDKLRALAKVFNVPVQNFSDVLDLGEFAKYAPESREVEDLLQAAKRHFSEGQHGRAIATYEAALSIAESEHQSLNRIAKIRLGIAASLRALGKLSLADAELRSILKVKDALREELLIQALFQMTDVYRQFGDYFLAEIVAREGVELAERTSQSHAVSAFQNTLANILHDQGRPDDALRLYESCVASAEQATAYPHLAIVHRINFGGCLASVGQTERALEVLTEAFAKARTAGYRRSMALAKNRSAEALYLSGAHAECEPLLTESDSISTTGDTSFNDILFMNTYIRWKIAQHDQNFTGEKIAFGRLRHLRALLERKFPEVFDFDQYVETHRRSHHA